MLSCRYTYGLTIQQTQEAVNEVRFCWPSLQDWVDVTFEIIQQLLQVVIASMRPSSACSLCQALSLYCLAALSLQGLPFPLITHITNTALMNQV